MKIKIVLIYTRRYFKNFEKYLEKKNIQSTVFKMFSETREKEENFDINIVIFRKELDLLWFIENQYTKNS